MITKQHTAHDRCDRCRAQGYTTWAKNQLTLTFCGHHGREYEPDLVVQGFTLLRDDTHLLTEA